MCSSDLRAGEAAVLRDVADEERRDVLPLRGEEQLRRRLADLARCCRAPTGTSSEEHGLDRVDDDERRPEARDLLEDPLEAGLRQQVQRRALDARARSPRDLIWCSDSSPEL